MAEERTLGLARAHEQTSEEPSKEELQRRLGEARDSISSTVTEIKETVANQVKAVKDTLDWREQFKRRPVAWSAAALGVGFATGYCIASYAKGDSAGYDSAIDRYGEESRQYAGAAMAAPAQSSRSTHGNGTHDSGPSFFKKVVHTPAFERVRDEAGNIGDAFVQELSKTAKSVVLPALITSLRNFIGDHLPNAEKKPSQQQRASSTYQPSLERNPS
ncbi:MAG TPA: hypothetical protein VGQ41_09585 [Pyrinomonadaceae bacterium]|jgi:hypothetical protein|nr:hypothetical protein [Pyrinomonadaceae bacterium]